MTAQESSGIGAAKALAGVSAAVLATALIGNTLTRGRRQTMRWYRRLEKPGFTPPGAVFPMVWTALYALIATSAWRVAQRPASPERKRALGLWLVQLALNAAWTPLFYSASGLITETGGPLSHGAVTAREMRLPAVMSVRNVMGILSDGQRVTVDGSRGLVVLHASNEG